MQNDNGTDIETKKGNRSKIENKILEKKIMKKVKKAITAGILCGIILTSVATTNAGIIVNLTRQKAETRCVETKQTRSAKFDTGIIVNLTGVIVNFTGVIVNLTGIIVNYTSTDTGKCS